ncbi:dipeptide/oligopeptide/nickel ABC transporter ATP-binding protein [Pseudonocardia sp.]|uniref:ABC transporter ATP-binding protein n=1 Tax=Pseudonocardia sp. TaxID=60912 RepID=UPI0026353825|nr:dipeptide/oligopeptide/nickel ABC transporter ATP-binding protein [Pseudonocardia sp.]
MPPPVSPALQAVDVSRRYGRGRGAVTAVAAASLTVAPGEIVGIHGSSGCGKSTLLRLLAGVERPTSGTVSLAGRPLAGRHPVPGAAMPILQDPVGSLDPRWPVWRSITEPLTAPHRPSRPDRAGRREIARERLETVGLAGLDLDARPGELSRGQCQRVAILRALVAEPAVVLADEPTSALDVSVSAGILHLLAGVAGRGAALVVVSHDLAVLDVLCHRVLVMTGGRLPG